MGNLKFEEMDLSAEILHAVSDLGFEEATPIQSESISIIRKGLDVIGQSQTGTGKTLAFGIPTVEMIDCDDRRLQAIIICPTRELAIQISEELRKILKYKDSIRVLPVYGGQPIDRQIMALKKGVQIVIGTPGRIMDHMRRHTLKMDAIKIAVLDEADEMFDMGFRDDIEEILSKTSEERQTILFSATMPKPILELTKKFQKNPEYIKIAHKELTVPSIEQVYFEVRENTKLAALCRLIDMYNPESSLIFCNTKKMVDDLVEQLQGRGYFAEALHGDLKQPQRDKVMSKFKNRTLEILVATDVAARGIDVYNIDIVFNYDVPQDEEYYVHRIGRTGRAGKSGRAYTFVVGKEIYKLRDIMRFANTKIVPKKLPSLTDIEEVKTRTFIDTVKGVIDEGHLSKYVNIVDSLISEDYVTIEIAAALMKMQLAELISVEEQDFSSDVEMAESRLYGGDKKKKDKYNLDGEKTSRLFLNVGRAQKVQAKDIVGALAGEANIPGKSIGAIDVFEDYSFVEVPKKFVTNILDAVGTIKIKGTVIHVEIAKAKKTDKSDRSDKTDKTEKSEGKTDKGYKKSKK